jgi:hypothetical protein
MTSGIKSSNTRVDKETIQVLTRSAHLSVWALLPGAQDPTKQAGQRAIDDVLGDLHLQYETVTGRNNRQRFDRSSIWLTIAKPLRFCAQAWLKRSLRPPG